MVGTISRLEICILVTGGAAFKWSRTYSGIDEPRSRQSHRKVPERSGSGPMKWPALPIMYSTLWCVVCWFGADQRMSVASSPILLAQGIRQINVRSYASHRGMGALYRREHLNRPESGLHRIPYTHSAPHWCRASCSGEKRQKWAASHQRYRPQPSMKRILAMF